jgi:hypothetical protein
VRHYGDLRRIEGKTLQTMQSWCAKVQGKAYARLGEECQPRHLCQGFYRDLTRRPGVGRPGAAVDRADCLLPLFGLNSIEPSPQRPH